MSGYGHHHGAGGSGYGGGGFGGGGGYGGGHGGGRGGGFGGGKRDLDAIHLQKPDFKQLMPFEKNFYVEHPAVQSRSLEEVKAYRHAREIHIDGHDIPKPVTTFEEASFPGEFATRSTLTGLGFAVYTVRSHLPWHTRKFPVLSQNTC